MKKIFLMIYLLPLFLQAQTLTDSLKAYWSFDGNSLDMTGNGHDATVFGATPVPDRFGNANGAYYFNGTTDYMTFTSSSKMQPNLPASISVWIMRTTPPAGPAADAIIGTEHNTNNGYYSGFWVNIMPYSGAIQINFGDNTGSCSYNYRRTITGYTNVCDGQWHLLTFVVTGATSMQLYIDCQAENGSLSGSGAINPVYSNATTGIIGNFLCGLNGNDGHFTGSIDDLSFYSRALSALDVAALYNFPNAISPNQGTVFLGNDTTICQSSFTLDATTTWANSYIWSNGSTGPTLNVSNAGTYSVQVIGSNCSEYAVDTIVVSGLIGVDLLPDTINCINQTITLNAGVGYNSYSWSTGDTTQSINISQAGSYIIQVTNIYGCSFSDTINVYNCTGIENIGLQVFPQPASETLHLRYTLENVENINFALYDMMGKKVKEMQFAKEIGAISHEIPIINLLKGVYVLRFFGQNMSTARKVIIE